MFVVAWGQRLKDGRFPAQVGVAVFSQSVQIALGTNLFPLQLKGT